MLFLRTSYKPKRPLGLKHFKRIVALNTIFTNPKEKIRLPFRPTLFKPKFWIKHYLITRILIARNINNNYVNKDDIITNWILTQNIPTNWMDGTFHHMSYSKEKPSAELPYGEMITRILSTFNIDTHWEKAISPNNIIDYTSLKDMKIDIKYEELRDDWMIEEKEYPKEIKDIDINQIEKFFKTYQET